MRETYARPAKTAENFMDASQTGSTRPRPIGFANVLHHGLTDSLRESIRQIATSRKWNLIQLDDAPEPDRIMGLERPGILVTRCASSDGATETLRRIRAGGCLIPIVIVSAGASTADAMSWVRCGAWTVWSDNYDRSRIQEDLAAAIDEDQELCELETFHRDVQNTIDQLTPRQRTVLSQVLDGNPTKAIAMRHQVSKRLVEAERSVLLRRFEVDGSADLALVMGQFRMLNRLQFRTDASHDSPAESSFAPHVDAVTTPPQRESKMPVNDRRDGTR